MYWETPSRRAISELVWPDATSSTTSRSRRVSPCAAPTISAISAGRLGWIDDADLVGAGRVPTVRSATIVTQRPLRVRARTAAVVDGSRSAACAARRPPRSAAARRNRRRRAARASAARPRRHAAHLERVAAEHEDPALAGVVAVVEVLADEHSLEPFGDRRGDAADELDVVGAEVGDIAAAQEHERAPRRGAVAEHGAHLVRSPDGTITSRQRALDAGSPPVASAERGHAAGGSGERGELVVVLARRPRVPTGAARGGASKPSSWKPLVANIVAGSTAKPHHRSDGHGDVDRRAHRPAELDDRVGVGARPLDRRGGARSTDRSCPRRQCARHGAVRATPKMLGLARRRAADRVVTTTPGDDDMSNHHHAPWARSSGPGSDDYERPASVWNGTIDRYPAMIARCRSTRGGRRRRRDGRDSGLEIAVRGGGHSIPGLSVCEGGLMIDLSPMKAVAGRPATRASRDAEPGALWADYDAATQAHGLASPGGEISHTGVAGLTLGGGIGWLSRTLRAGLRQPVGARDRARRRNDPRGRRRERRPS